VAVLLFRLRGEPAEEYLTHGLTEEIIDRLSSSERLLVTTFGVVSTLDPELRDPAVLGPRLRVHVIVDGTLRLLPGGMVATVRLVEAERGLQYAVRRIERADRNALLLAQEVTRVVGSLLTIQFDRSPADVIGDPVAVDLYLRARHQYHALHAEGAAASVALFEQALARLPADPVLLTGHALALSRHWFFSGEDAAARATQAAERAMQAAPEQGESLLAQATVHFNSNRLLETARSLRLALPRAPRLAEAHELVGILMTEAGAQIVGLRHLNHALLLDATVPRVRFAMAQAQALAGQLDSALATLFWPGCDPTFAVVRWVALARLLSWFRDGERARAYLEDPALAAPEHRMNRRRMAFIAGERMIALDEYIQFSYQTSAASPRTHVLGLQLATEYHLLRGQLADARATLGQLGEYQLGDIHWLDCCPLLAPLRDTPEFAGLRAAAEDLSRRILRALGVGPL
jgi:serine/threonine-protein kinase